MFFAISANHHFKVDCLFPKWRVFKPASSKTKKNKNHSLYISILSLHIACWENTSPLPLFQYLSTCSKVNYDSDPTSYLTTTILSAGVCVQHILSDANLQSKAQFLTWRRIWAFEPEAAQHVTCFAWICMDLSELDVISHVCLPCCCDDRCDRCCTVEEVSSYGFKQITSSWSYCLLEIYKS